MTESLRFRNSKVELYYAYICWQLRLYNSDRTLTVNCVEAGMASLALISLLLAGTALVFIGFKSLSRAAGRTNKRNLELRFELVRANALAQALCAGFESMMSVTSPYVYRRTQIEVSTKIERYGRWPWQKHCVIVFSIGLTESRDLSELREELNEFIHSYLSSSEEEKFVVRRSFYWSNLGPQGVVACPRRSS